MVKKKNLLWTALVTIVVFYLSIQILSWVVSNKTTISAHCNQVKSLIDLNQPTLQKIFNNSFDQAVLCQSVECSQNLIKEAHASLQETDKVKFFQTSYFIRLNNDGNIEKWFWSGEVKTTIPTTSGEKQVVRVLQGRSRPICTQSWKIDSVHTQMTYLHDGYSEAETIIPIRSESTVIGAIVSRFGD